MPAPCRPPARVISSAALRARRFISCTVRITVWSGAASLMSRHNPRARSNSGRTLTRVEIFSEKTRVHPAACSATSWLASSCRAVEQRAYPTRIGLPAGTSAAPASTAGQGDQGLPGERSAGTETFSSSRSAGTRMNRAVW